MNGVMLDTNVLINLFRNPKAFVDRLCSFDVVLLPTIVLGEFRAGLSKSVQDLAIGKVLTEYLENPSVRVVEITAKTSFYYAEVFRHLKSVGHPIPQNDVWIAAAALEHGVPLCSSDAHFASIPMLQVLT